MAIKLPVFFYGKVKFSCMTGEVVIDAPIKKGMIGFGQRYEMNTVAQGIAEINIQGKIIFRGHVQFGKDYFVYIGKNALCEMGHMSSLGSRGKIICTHKVVLGTYARLGSESQIIDTNFHGLLNTKTNELYPMQSKIQIGNFNFFGNRVSVMGKTKTPNYCTVASNSVCNKDYSSYGENVLIGGVPSKLLRTNISRDWQGEEEMMLKSLII
ncbi:acyltransferase [Mangrovimonas aestuarii]|uniref:acyltransferase n=1 Tax=Mangrovimonas aestuarii TaxID=3018443 RepID=UPI002379C5E4|nr:transferase [Mangrovimonas aestuarii]